MQKATTNKESRQDKPRRAARPHGVYDSAHGFPSPTKDHEEGPVDPHAWLMRRSGSTFWLKVEDDHLSDHGILAGDMLAVDRDRARRVGDIVLAVHDGEYVTGQLGKGRSGYLLQTGTLANPSTPIPFTPDTEVFGVVIGLFRSYRT